MLGCPESCFPTPFFEKNKAGTGDKKNKTRHWNRHEIRTLYPTATGLQSTERLENKAQTEKKKKRHFFYYRSSQCAPLEIN